MRAMTKARERTLHNACDLVVLVEVDELLLRRLGRRPVRRVALPAEGDVRQVQAYTSSACAPERTTNEFT